MVCYSVREMKREEIDGMIDYFLHAEPGFLLGMGVDVQKLPTKQEWKQKLWGEFDLPLEEKTFYYLVWELDGQPVGHSNINKIKFGEEAFMHLHLWTPEVRQSGLGSYFIRQSIPFYFEKFQLQKLFCEPYSLNPGPNKTLKRIGFEFLKAYETIPGWINLPQTVNRWVMKKEAFEKMNINSLG